MLKRKNKKNLVRFIIEYAKLQLASNIPFWGTYFGYALLYSVLHVPSFYALAIPTVLSNVLFFIVDDKWVFTDSRGKRKSTTEIMRFIIFTIVSALVFFGITTSLEIFYGISPYIGQFITGLLASLWTFAGLRFWVFAPIKRRRAASTKKAAARTKPRRRKVRTA